MPHSTGPLADAAGGEDLGPARCPACGFDNPPAMRFCGGCGRPLEPIPRSEARTSADRRQLTVVFCDLVGSTELAERLDPEELGEVVREYQRTASAVVERYEGSVAQYLGDGLLVYFGHPQAHEDDPRRALHAALAIVAAVAELSRRTEADRGCRLAVRVGVHTGEVVTSEIGDRREQLALGAVPNVAARLQGLAEPGAVVVSAATAELIRGYFELRPLGEVPLKGLSRPVEVYAVAGESGVGSRFELAVNRGLAPFVGREAELAALVGLFEEAAAGPGRIALVQGEAGIGKSRLVHQVREALAGRGRDHGWLLGRCSAYHGQSAYHPVIDLLVRHFRLDGPVAGGEPRDRLERLERGLAVLGEDRAEALPFFAALLGVPIEGGDPTLASPPEWRKRRTLEAVLLLLERLAGRRPVILVLEDLHWVDPSTRELLDLVVERRPARVLALLTCRRAFEDPWLADPGLHRLELGSLDDHEVERLLDGVAGGREMAPELRRAVIERTDGIPLFVEELTAAVLESGSPSIPATLQDSLAARLDRLEDAREVAQLGSVIGRAFGERLLAALCRREVGNLQEKLDRLVGSGLCFRRGEPPEATYVFKHALVQEAAYASLLKSQRRALHGRIARALVAEQPARAEAEPEVVAGHFTEAGMAEEAAEHWLLAGNRAAERAATQEALQHIENGLRLLAELPAGVRRQRLELGLQMVRGTVYMTRESYASGEAERSFLRARELSAELGEEGPEYGLGVFYMVRGELAKARELCEGLRRRSDSRTRLSVWLGARHTLAVAGYAAGEHQGSHEELEEIVALCGREPRGLTFPTGEDIEAIARAWNALPLWHLGRPAASREAVEGALERARRTDYPYNVAYALLGAAWVRQLRREPEAVLPLALESVTVSEERGFFWTLLARVLVGWARIHGAGLGAGGAEGELEAMRRGLEVYQAAGARLTLTYFLGLVAESCIATGRHEEAEATLEQAFGVARETGESSWLPELRRLEGQLVLARAAAAGRLDAESAKPAEAAFRDALLLARSQGSLSLELRAAADLVRAATDPEARAEARELLAGLCKAFPEQGPSADLDAARALLSE
jgi:class 3 adenylate cyclase/tetratricopeptide (TPR) repeat protein